MARAGRKRLVGAKRVNGRLSQRQDDLRDRGALVYTDVVVYLARSQLGVKIGYTGNLHIRMVQIGIDYGGGKPLVLGCIHCPSHAVARALEAKLHRIFSERNKKIKGEWFDLNETDVRAALDMAEKIGLKTTGQTDIPYLHIGTNLALTLDGDSSVYGKGQTAA